MATSSSIMFSARRARISPLLGIRTLAPAIPPVVPQRYRHQHARAWSSSPWSSSSSSSSSLSMMARMTSSSRTLSRDIRSSSPRNFASSSSSVLGDGDKGDDDLDVSPTQTSLALSVHFLHPDMGMKEYEILSRATAFLLAADPPTPDDDGDDEAADDESPSTLSRDKQGRIKKTAFPHLRKNKRERERLLEKQEYAYDKAGGPRRFPHQLNWLEFCPSAFRPSVHVVASSHVLSPWMWPKYYGQDWLKSVKAEHVRYSLEVYGVPKKKKKAGEDDGAMTHDGKLRGGPHEPLAKFALNPFPIHHPNDMDLALIHLKQEDTALKHLMDLGVKPLHLRSMYELESSTDPVFEAGQRVLFQGFEVADAGDDSSGVDSADDDTRVFHPYSASGSLTFGSEDRFLASTDGRDGPLPEGLCGGAVLDLPGPSTVLRADKDPLYIRGVVEGIVPPNHENSELAGSASFLPAHRVREFVDYAERLMLENIIPEDMFEKVVELKEGSPDDRGAGTVRTVRDDNKVYEGEPTQQPQKRKKRGGRDDDDGENDPATQRDMEVMSENDESPHLDQQYEEIVASLRENHTPEEVDAILATVDSEREEVIKIMEKEGGEMDDIIEQVRRRTYEKRDEVFRDIQTRMEAAQQRGESEIPEAEIVEIGDDDGADVGRLTRRRKRESKDDAEEDGVSK